MVGKCPYSFYLIAIYSLNDYLANFGDPLWNDIGYIVELAAILYADDFLFTWLIFFVQMAAFSVLVFF